MAFESIKEDINSVFKRDPAARSKWDILINYPGLHAIWIYRLTNKLWLADWKRLARFISTFARWVTGVEIHPGATIGRRFFIDHAMGVVIGETAVIGNDCTLYHGVTLGGTSWEAGKRHPTLKDNVVVGAGAKILGPITLHSGARVGSNAVIVRDVPENATAIGIPGHVIEDDCQKKQSEREKLHQLIGFEAYGATSSYYDPVAQVISSMLDHSRAVDEQMRILVKTLKDRDIKIEELDLPGIHVADFIESLEDLDDCGEPVSKSGSASDSKAKAKAKSKAQTKTKSKTAKKATSKKKTTAKSKKS
ncbi:MAG: serine O-acetyltransferase [Gammaproteobacteria bacterium]|nr:serine O-acetyltransferase [Gammaproteobacteria bacterium]